MPVTLPCHGQEAHDGFLNMPSVRLDGIFCSQCHRHYKPAELDLLLGLAQTVTPQITPIPDPSVISPNPCVPPTKGTDLRRAAEQWIAKNPAIYQAFEHLALAKGTLGERFNIGLLAEKIRDDKSLWTTGSPFKLPNAHRAYIARKLVADHPQLQGLLSFRETRS